MTKCYRNVVEKDRNRPSVHQRMRGRATVVQPYDGTSLGCEKERRTNVTDLENVTLRGARHKRQQLLKHANRSFSGKGQELAIPLELVQSRFSLAGLGDTSPAGLTSWAFGCPSLGSVLEAGALDTGCKPCALGRTLEVGGVSLHGGVPGVEWTVRACLGLPSCCDAFSCSPPA